MSVKDDGSRAFPLSRENEGWFEGGMFLRDYFAARVLPTMITAMYQLSSEGMDMGGDKNIMKIASEKAYLAADEMLLARTHEN